MNLNQIEVNGLKFLVRPGSSDETAIREVVEKKTYERRVFQIESGEHWLDLGGNVGAFTVLAASKGATVETYEPDPENVALIRKNLELNGLTAKVIAKAVVPDKQVAATLNLWPGGKSWRNSIIRNKKGTQPLTVLCQNVFELIKPDTCIKMDIEGSEIGILESWPETLRCKKLVVEYSFDVDPNVLRLRRILDKFKNIFTNIKYTSQVDKIERWNFFPPATMLHFY